MYEAIDVRLFYFPFFFSFDLDSIFLTLDSAPCSLSLSLGFSLQSGGRRLLGAAASQRLLLFSHPDGSALFLPTKSRRK
jgi:hypothetical protein